MNKAQHVNKRLFTKASHALRAFFTKLDQINIAIVLSEAGDVEGAKAQLAKHDKLSKSEKKI